MAKGSTSMPMETKLMRRRKVTVIATAKTLKDIPQLEKLLNATDMLVRYSRRQSLQKRSPNQPNS
jgi:hypothetical protein